LDWDVVLGAGSDDRVLSANAPAALRPWMPTVTMSAAITDFMLCSCLVCPAASGCCGAYMDEFGGNRQAVTTSRLREVG
jgi:hypothetical protein